MQQQFYINQHSTLPTLKLELINDGRHNFRKFFEAVQNCDITFTMVNSQTSVIKIASEKAYICPKSNDSLSDEYLICYDWKPRDTKEKGVFEGYFTLKFDGSLTSEYDVYPKGELIIPIREKLIISIL